MPTIDVTEVLFDSDVAGQAFTVIRRQETVNGFGESTWTNKTIYPVYGSVQSDSPNELIREEADDAQNKTVQVITTFRLRGVSKGPASTRYKPDLVQPSDGNTYEVVDFVDYSAFGAGMVAAICKAIPWVDEPPPPLAPRVGQLDFSRGSNSGLAYPVGGAF